MPPLALCAYMKKGPNLRWSLIQCSGGDEGNRTPDLLTASQALSQLSYAPVRKSTIRELRRRCKDNFGKLSPPRRGGAARPRGIADPAFPAPVRSPPGDLPPRNRPIYYVRPAPPDHAVLGKIKPQVDGLRFSLYTGRGRGVGLKRSRWAGFVAAAWRAAAPRRHEAAKQLSSDRFPANYTGRWPVAQFPSSFGFLFCTCSVIPNVSKDFARSNQAAQHR